MNRKLLLLFLLCLITLQASAQDSIRKSIISLNILSPTYSQAPRIAVGYMHKVTPRIWVGTELGYGTKSLMIDGTAGDDNTEKDYRLFEIRPSVYYDLRPTGRLKHLVSAEVYYIHHKDRFYNDDYYDTKNYITYDYDRADYTRHKYGINFNYNVLYNFGSHFSLMQTMGFGVRIREVKFTNVINKTENPYGDDSDTFVFNTTNYLRESGTNTAFNFNLDLKLLYKF